MQIKSLLAAGAALSALLGAQLMAPQAGAQSYRNKTVTIVVGFGAGGGADTFGRLLGRHLGDNIPDNPSVIVQNMPGAGGFKATNHVYAKAPKDGTQLILTASAHATAPAMGNKAARWDMFKFQWLGNLTRESASCVASGPSGVKSVMDGKNRQIIFGASGKSATSAIQPRLLANLLGLNLKIIAGYKGTASQRLAMEKGELDATCSFWASLALGPQRKEVESGKLVPIVQFGSKAHPAFGNAPVAYDLAVNDDDRKVMRFIYGPSEISRPFAVAPGVPAAQVALLRDSFWKTVTSEALKADAGKLRLIVDPMDWKETEASLREALDVPQKIVERAKWATTNTN
jgi:tripartite-type tricarboxylate transporter receptor subunit TctC